MYELENSTMLMLHHLLCVPFMARLVSVCKESSAKQAKPVKILENGRRICKKSRLRRKKTPLATLAGPKKTPLAALAGPPPLTMTPVAVSPPSPPRVQGVMHRRQTVMSQRASVGTT